MDRWLPIDTAQRDGRMLIVTDAATPAVADALRRASNIAAYQRSTSKQRSDFDQAYFACWDKTKHGWIDRSARTPPQAIVVAEMILS